MSGDQGNVLARLFQRATTGPEYPPNEADLRDIRLFGLVLPRRASIAVLAVTALIVADQLRLLIPESATEGLAGLRPLDAQRFVLFGVVPALVVVLGFRDDLRRYAAVRRGVLPKIVEFVVVENCSVRLYRALVLSAPQAPDTLPSTTRVGFEARYTFC